MGMFSLTSHSNKEFNKSTENGLIHEINILRYHSLLTHSQSCHTIIAGMTVSDTLPLSKMHDFSSPIIHLETHISAPKYDEAHLLYPRKLQACQRKRPLVDFPLSQLPCTGLDT